MQESLTLKMIQASIKDALINNDKALIKGLGIIYSYQTRDEKESERTIYDNGEGFTGVDADFLTSVYHNYERFQSLSHKQINCVRRCMVKYAGQLMRHAIASGVYEQIPGTKRWRRVPSQSN